MQHTALVKKAPVSVVHIPVTAQVFIIATGALCNSAGN
jgi:hypothetical protein